MPTKVGVGVSENPTSLDAGREAARAALVEVGVSTCDLAIMFSTPKHDPIQLRDGVRSVIGPSARLIGGYSVGIITKDMLGYEGYQVGVLDADITGPSIPMLFGLHGPVDPGPVGMKPLKSRGGVKVISMNFLLESEDQPVIWRGPLIGRAIKQLWGDVMWGNLDYLLVDLPPGTSDAALTTMQALPVNGIVMVTTPQCLAAMVVRKAVHMAQAIKTPIIGVIENMAYFVCPDTGGKHFIFGHSHVSEVLQAASAPLLAQLPIDPQLSALCDEGNVELVTLAEIPDLLNAFIHAVPVMAPSPA